MDTGWFSRILLARLAGVALSCQLITCMSGKQYPPLTLALIAWLIVTVAGLVPPYARDALNDHLMLPILWQEHGWFWRDRQLAFTAYPPLADIPYLLFSGHPWDWAASVWHACGALVTLVFLDRTMANLDVGHNSRMWGCLLWITMPCVIALCGWEYVDLWLCATAAVISSILTLPRLNSRLTWTLGGIAGLALLIKYNGLAIALGSGLGLLWSNSQRPRQAIASAIRFSLALILVSSWWYLSNALIYGHPLFPVGNGNGQLGWLQYRIHAYGETPLWAALAPLRVYFWGEANNPRLFDGMLSPILFAALPALWAFRNDRRKMAIGIAGLVYIIISLSAGVRARYILPATVFLLPLAMSWLADQAKYIRLPAIFASIFLACLASLIYLRELAPWQFWLHGRDAFLQQHVPDYPIQRWIAHNIPKDASIYLLWMGGRAYYLNHPYRFDFGTEGQTLREHLSTGDAYPQSYILLRRDLADQTIGKDLPTKWKEFIDSSCLQVRYGPFELREMTACKSPS